jgi:uncharacterized protein YjeT (DUF2065 family)
MIEQLLLAVGLVAIVEGLVLALAPGQLTAALEAIARLDRAASPDRAARCDGRDRPCLGRAGVRSWASPGRTKP